MRSICFYPLIFHFSYNSDPKPGAQLSPSASYVFEWQIEVLPLSELFYNLSLVMMHTGSIVCGSPQARLNFESTEFFKSCLLMLFWFWLSLRWVTEILWSRWEDPQSNTAIIRRHILASLECLEQVFSKNYLVALSRGLLRFLFPL